MKKPSWKESGKAAPGLLGVIVLATAALGVWSEFHVESATSPVSITKQVQVRAFDSDGRLFASANLDEQPDGSFLVNVSAGGWNPELQTFTDLEVGESWQTMKAARGSIALTERTVVRDEIAPANVQASFEAPGTLRTLAPSEAATIPFGYEWTVTPVIVHGLMTVRESSTLLGDWNADYFGQFNDHDLKLFSTSDWNASTTYAARVTKIGNQAYTLTGGSLSLMVNGQPFASASGVYGEMQDRKTHTVTEVDR